MTLTHIIPKSMGTAIHVDNKNEAPDFGDYDPANNCLRGLNAQAWKIIYEVEKRSSTSVAGLEDSLGIDYLEIQRFVDKMVYYGAFELNKSRNGLPSYSLAQKARISGNRIKLP